MGFGHFCGPGRQPNASSPSGPRRSLSPSRPQPAETEVQTSELGSNRQTASPSPVVGPDSGKPVASEGPRRPVEALKSA
ncbi:hypothetical protein SBA6_60024 [Candidatus Sulfopaludibacter sp. SbA6]|nr:hypothetical protein SBA6_60024 [Candidatus Sulfopaludibacter sp. SbA6]